MSTRERWLTTGLVATLLLLVGTAFWQQVRYNDAREAVSGYLRLEAVTRTGEDSGEGNGEGSGEGSGAELEETALLRQARPEIERYLRRGEFDRARRRLASLSEEDRPGRVEANGKGIPVDELWPPNSPERERARKVLRELVEKQKQGFDMEPAHETLVRLADAARRGQRKEALVAFTEVERQVRQAPRRPGFAAARPPVRPGGTAPAEGTAPAQPAPGADARVARMVQFFQRVLPQLAQSIDHPQIPEEQRENLRGMLSALQPLGREVLAAHRQGKDLRPVVPLFQELGRATREQDERRTRALLQKALAAVRQAKPLPGGKPAKAPPAVAAVVPRNGAAPETAGPAPKLPPVDGSRLPGGLAPGGLAPGGALGERLLAVLDDIRKMPETEYQQKRPQMLLFFSQAIASAVGGAPGAPARPAGGSRGPAIGDPGTLRLELTPSGGIAGLRAAGTDLSPGLPEGGLAVLAGGRELPLRAPADRDGNQVRQTVSGPLGRLVATYSREGDGLVVHVRSRGSGGNGAAGGPEALLLRVPLRAAGWRWRAGGESAVIAVDQTVNAVQSEGKLETVHLDGAGLSLAVAADTAASITYEPSGMLVVRLPVSPDGVTEHVVRLRAEKR